MRRTADHVALARLVSPSVVLLLLASGCTLDTMGTLDVGMPGSDASYDAPDGNPGQDVVAETAEDAAEEDATSEDVSLQDVQDEDATIPDAQEEDAQLETIGDPVPEEANPGCTGDPECSDLEPCNGTEVCTESGNCTAGAPPDQGTSCSTAQIPNGTCSSGVCTSPVCGNAVVEQGEECDQPSTTPGTCTTACGTTGSRVCNACSWSNCAPPADTCNGVDDDCDGVIDAIVTRVTTSTGVSTDPALVWNSSGYGLSWSDNRTGNYEIFFSRITAAGSEVGDDIQLTATGENSSTPSLVWTGTEYGVLWNDGPNNSSAVDFLRLGASGAALGTPLQVPTQLKAEVNSALVWTGAQYALAWTDTRNSGQWDVYTATLSPLGTKSSADNNITPVSNGSGSPSIAWSGTGFGTAWHDNRDGNWEIYFARLNTAAATKLGAEVRITSNNQWSRTPWVVWSATDWGLAWTDNRDGNYEIYMSRVAAAGTKVGGDTRLTTQAADSNHPSVAWTGTDYGLVWADNRDGNYEIYFKRMPHDLATVGTDVRVTESAGDSTSPVVVWTGSHFGVAWQDTRDGDPEIYLATLICP
jgi:hypothetical protein